MGDIHVTLKVKFRAFLITFVVIDRDFNLSELLRTLVPIPQLPAAAIHYAYDDHGVRLGYGIW